MTRLVPGSVIGILGGGQLGRLMALEAARLGFRTHIYCPDASVPAFDVAPEYTRAAYDDADALGRFAKAADVITYEFENVPVTTVTAIEAAGGTVRPGARALEYGQDRLVEKQFLNGLGIPTTSFVGIGAPDEIEPALRDLGGKAILKRRRDGYDGKGQARIRGAHDIQVASALCDAPCILETWSPFVSEISIVLARGLDGEIAIFDPPQNTHIDGILRRSVIPADISQTTEAAARSAATKLIEALDYVGVLALEFFVMEDGSVLANEFAPRVHNSGHWTPEICQTGQFEQHIRAIAGWPLGPTERLFDGEMHNLLGEEVLGLPDAFPADAKPVIYGKREPRAGRKMGHVTVRRPKT